MRSVTAEQKSKNSQLRNLPYTSFMHLKRSISRSYCECGEEWTPKANAVCAVTASRVSTKSFPNNELVRKCDHPLQLLKSLRNHLKRATLPGLHPTLINRKGGILSTATSNDMSRR